MRVAHAWVLCFPAADVQSRTVLLVLIPSEGSQPHGLSAELPPWGSVQGPLASFSQGSLLYSLVAPTPAGLSVFPEGRDSAQRCLLPSVFPAVPSLRCVVTLPDSRCHRRHRARGGGGSFPSPGLDLVC